VTPCLGFTLNRKGVNESPEVLKPVWSIAIDDIKEIRKIGGLGWKGEMNCLPVRRISFSKGTNWTTGKLVTGWAMDKPVQDGIEIVDSLGERRVCTALALRDELFNRLIAMNAKMWKVC
jgi:hypothetical protein